jgi:LysR family glycine cleavage system transcriptional activator
MSRRLPPLNAIKAFEAAARLGNIAQAAAELNVTRGAVSQQIKLLEDFLGVDLFDRGARRMTLSAAGQALLPVLSHALDSIAGEAAKLKRPELRGQLVVASAPAFGSKWLLRHLADFIRLYPEVDIRIRTIQPLARELPVDCDVAIEWGHGHWPGSTVYPFDPADLTPVCSPKLINALPQKIRSPNDLQHVRLIHDDDGTRWRRWLAETGATAVNPAKGLFLDNFVYALDAAVAGLGVVLADPVTTAEDMRTGALVSPLDHKLPGDGSYHVVVPRGREANLLASAFVSWLLACHQFNADTSVLPTTNEDQL